MAGEYFKLTQIWQRFGKGFRQYPFSMGNFVSLTAGSAETVIGVGVVPDGPAIYNTIPPFDEHETSELSLSDHIDPPFIFDDTGMTGLRESA